MKTVKIPTHLSKQELMSLIGSIESAFGCELTRVYPDRATFIMIEPETSYGPFDDSLEYHESFA